MINEVSVSLRSDQRVTLLPAGSLRRLPLASDAACLLALCGFSLAVVHSELMAERPQLVGTAVFLDLVVTTAACHWLLGVRLGGLPAWTVIPLAGAGLALSQLILPASVVERGLLPLALAGVVEGALLLLVALRIRTVARGFRAERQRGADGFAAFEAGLLGLGAYAAPAARWARLELELWYFALAGWLSKAHVPAGAAAFSHHREAGWSVIAGVLALLILIEGALVHLWLESAGFELLKWLLFAGHVYGLIWLLGDAQALRLRRTLLHSVALGAGSPQLVLDLRLGVRARARFALSEMAEVSTGTWDEARPNEQLLSVSGPANLRIAFHTDVQLTPALRAPVRLRALLVQVDEPARLAAALSEGMQRSPTALHGRTAPPAARRGPE